MVTKINKTDALIQKMKKEGKVSELNRPADIKLIVAMNEELETVRREYHIKDRNSQITAASVILTA